MSIADENDKDSHLKSMHNKIVQYEKDKQKLKKELEQVNKLTAEIRALRKGKEIKSGLKKSKLFTYLTQEVLPVVKKRCESIGLPTEAYTGEGDYKVPGPDSYLDISRHNLTKKVSTIKKHPARLNDGKEFKKLRGKLKDIELGVKIDYGDHLASEDFE